MNLLDENFPENQEPLLVEWRVPFRRIGREVSRLGAKDADIIPVLHEVGRVTLFTQDRGFFKPRLCHAAYCLVWLDVPADDAAVYLRRLLKHPRFDSQAKRMGTSVRVRSTRIEYWQRNLAELQHAGWPQG